MSPLAKRIADLERRTGGGEPPPRLYLKNEDGGWFRGEPPPPGRPGPRDVVLTLRFVAPHPDPDDPEVEAADTP